MTINVSTNNDFAKIISSLPESFQSDLVEFLTSTEELFHRDPATTDFATIETAMIATVKKLGLGGLRSYLEQLDDGAPAIRRDGRSWHRLPPSKGSLTCLLGKVDYQRSRYRCGRMRNSVCPVDESLGLLEGSLTRPASKLAMYLMAECPPRNCHKLLQQAGGMTPSVTTLQRVLQETHWAWQNTTEEALVDIRAAEERPKEATSVAVSLDGAMVHLRPGEHPIGSEHGANTSGGNWREAACGTLSFHDKDGNTLRTISSGRMPEKNKLALKKWLTQELEVVLSKRSDLTFVTVADGAPDNWSFLSRLASDAEVLDFYHATSHLRGAAEHAHTSIKWFGKWRRILRHDHDGVKRVIGAIRGLRDRAKSAAAKKQLEVVLDYFYTHRHRMNYAVLSERGLPIGSGIVEAANKTHLQERLKRSGMRWGMEGGQAVLTFRSLVKSNRFDQAWDWIIKEIDNRSPDNDNWQQYYEQKAA